MQPNKTLSLGLVESNLNRVGQRPVAAYLNALSQGIDERIESTQHSESSKKHPCPTCKGAGWLLLSGDLFAFSPDDKLLKPLKRGSGGNIGASLPIECPRCLGTQVDVMAMTKGVAA
ncbi:hypothetical protein ACJJI5_12310 [Microbulbifer sp. EKSA008]|uniref:hypothetical protein n=1 Tax=Microbulbifer sp. EKSA008 TaxID=3243367 RepID=UPI0040416200